MTEIRLNNLTKGYDTQDGRKVVISDLTASFPSGSSSAIVGANGCGKTTLLNLIATTASPDAGSVEFASSNGAAVRIGYVWQDYRASLLPWYSVWQNIAFPLELQGVGRQVARDIAAQALSGFATDIRLDDPVYKLSGGQQQLVSLLRSSVTHPDILLLDEPLSALDQFTGWSMAFRIEQFWLRNKITTVFVSHDVDEAVLLSDRVLLMSRADGRITRILENNLPRPRNVKMLTSTEHSRCRDEVIQFLAEEGAIRDHNGS